MSTRPPLEDWVRHAHLVSSGDYFRKVDETWQAWDHGRRQWFDAPSLMVEAINREMGR